jgi:hypothetical protein
VAWAYVPSMLGDPLGLYRPKLIAQELIAVKNRLARGETAAKEAQAEVAPSVKVVTSNSVVVPMVPDEGPAMRVESML